MDDRTLEALKGSIAKWEGIVAGTIQDEGILNCPLCKLFHLGGCQGCPVAETAGVSYCANTPYRDYVMASGQVDMEELSISTGGSLDNVELENLKVREKEVAQAELDFLKSLLLKELQNENTA